MNEIFQALIERINKGEVAAYCTVVETKGSTPQKPGSKLLILPDLRSVGTLGGGCVEAEARQQAIGLMQGGTPRLLEFRLDSDYGWDDGLICGGNMKIFIDLPKTRLESTLLTHSEELAEAKIPHVWATVVKSDDSAIDVGSKLLLTQDGNAEGVLQNDALLSAIREELDEALATDTPSVLHWEGDRVWVFLEPRQPKPTLLIAGAGHVGQALCHLADWLGFNVVIVDDRADFASAQRLPEASQIIVGDIAGELRKYPIDPLTYVVVVTRGHHHDEEALHSVIDSPARYIGLIGSRRKVKLIFDDLIELGVSPERLAQVYSPIGLDIHSKSVPEIAVSIAAQLIQVRNSKTPGVLLDSTPRRMPTVRVCA